jgi:hypothetical protein
MVAYHSHHKKCGRVGDDEDDGDDAGELPGQEKGRQELDGSDLSVRTLGEGDGRLVQMCYAIHCTGIWV